jgi:hypothetical protein
VVIDDYSIPNCKTACDDYLESIGESALVTVRRPHRTRACCTSARHRAMRTRQRSSDCRSCRSEVPVR